MSDIGIFHPPTLVVSTCEHFITCCKIKCMIMSVTSHVIFHSLSGLCKEVALLRVQLSEQFVLVGHVLTFLLVSCTWNTFKFGSMGGGGRKVREANL